MSGVMMAVLGSGGVPSSGLETHTLTTGTAGTIPNRQRGYILASIGTLSPTATSLGGATQMTAIYYNEAVPAYYLRLNGGINSGWTDMTIDSTKILSRASGTYDPATYTWEWTTTDTISTQAFGGGGTSHTIVFT